MIVQRYDLKGDFTMLNLFSETFKKILISIRKFRLSKKYSKRIHIGARNKEQLVNFLNAQGIVKKEDLSCIKNSIIGTYLYNLLDCKGDFSQYLKNPLSVAENNGFKFELYIFPKCNNENFYKKYTPETEEYIYVIFESTTDTFECNCSRLKLELFTFRGITHHDFVNQTENYYSQLFYLECLDKKIY